MVSVEEICVMYGERCCMRPYARNGAFSGSIHAHPAPGIVLDGGASFAEEVGFVDWQRFDWRKSRRRWTVVRICEMVLDRPAKVNTLILLACEMALLVKDDEVGYFSTMVPLQLCARKSAVGRAHFEGLAQSASEGDPRLTRVLLEQDVVIRKVQQLTTGSSDH